MNTVLREIVVWCDANGGDAAQAVLDYMDEKDSRMGRKWAEWKVAQIRAALEKERLQSKGEE